MARTRRLVVLAGLALLAAGLALATVPLAGAPPETILLADPLLEAGRGWLEDDFSRFDGEGYVIDARGAGGYPRWLSTPLDRADVRVSVAAEPLSLGPGGSYGLLLRVGGSWENAYSFTLDGSGVWRFGKFVGGHQIVVRQGQATAPADGPVRLEVLAQGEQFQLTLADKVVASLADPTHAGPGSVGLIAQAPAIVRFSDLQVTAPARPAAQEPMAPPAPRPLLLDNFAQAGDWPLDDRRHLVEGSYRLQSADPQGSLMSWSPGSDGLTHFTARLDTWQVAGGQGALFGLLWRVQDALNYYFMVIAPDGRFHAGRCQAGVPEQRAAGYTEALRPGGARNSLQISAVGTQHRLSINGAQVAVFEDDYFAHGALGVYLQGAGEVAFDDLVVLAEAAPGQLMANAAGAGEAGQLVLDDPLLADLGARAWPLDADHAYEQGGLVVRAPAQGSRSTLRAAPTDFGDGRLSVRARPVQGSVQAAYGLLFRATPAGDSFYFLLLNGAGQYYIGRCLEGQYTVFEAGQVAALRGGDLGNEFQVTCQGSSIVYSINDEELGRLEDDALAAGGVGVHVENGAVAVFRDLRLWQ